MRWTLRPRRNKESSSITCRTRRRRKREWATSDRLQRFVRDHDVPGDFSKKDMLVWDALLEFQEREGIEGHIVESEEVELLDSFEKISQAGDLALPKLKDLDNIYFDTSSNCDPLAHIAIIRNFGHKKLMYGSDGLLSSHIRGQTVAVADSFLWLQDDQPIWSTEYKQIEPVLIGLEHLRSLKCATYALKLSDTAVEDIFWNNAAELFALT